MAYNPSNPNGQATMANSEPVVIASDQSAIPVSDNGGSLTVDGSLSVSNFPAVQPVSGQLEVTKAGLWTLDSNSGVDIGDVTINNAAGASAVNIQDGGNSITVDGSVTATQPSSTAYLVQISDGASNVPIDAAHSDGDANTENHIDVGAKIMVFNGTNWDRQRGDTTGTFMVGNVAHDAADSGNPVKIGFQAENVLSAPVANGDRANAVSDVFGRQLIAHIDAGMQVWRSANYTTQQTGASIWTPSAGKKICITYLAVSSYATTGARVIVWFGASGDTTYTAGTDQLVWAGSFAPSANSRPGAIIQLPFGITAVTADHQLRITTDAGISLDVTVYGYEC